MKARLIFKITVLAITLFLMCNSCEKPKVDNQDTICGTKDPLQELEWLKNLTNGQGNGARREIYLFTYKGEKVFFIDNCVKCPDGIAEVYDCEGNVICTFGGFMRMNTCPDFDSLAVKDSLFWKNY